MLIQKRILANITRNLMEAYPQSSVEDVWLVGPFLVVKESLQVLHMSVSLLCRSILTYPWVELGGRTLIKCVKSGYAAVVLFHTKVF